MSGTTPSGRSPASVRMVKPGSHGIVSISGSNFRIAIWGGYLGQLRGKYIWRGLNVLRRKVRFWGLDKRGDCSWRIHHGEGETPSRQPAGRRRYKSCGASLRRTGEGVPTHHAKCRRVGDPGACPHVDWGSFDGETPALHFAQARSYDPAAAEANLGGDGRARINCCV